MTQVPSPTYAALSSELLAFNRLNVERDRCGFGKVAQNAKLDASAAAHRAYIVTNQAFAHTETQGLPGFTGVNPFDRDVAQGYFGSIAEDLSASVSSPATFSDGERQTLVLAGATYHANVITEGYRDVGISWGGGAFAMELGTPTGQSAQTAPGVRTYPCDGSTDVLASISSEEPNPFPNQSTSWGPTIQVIGEQIRITSAAITGPAGSVALKATYADGQQADPNAHCLGNRGCVIPAPLLPSTVYHVQVAGTQAGQAFTKAFSFTTSSKP
ncbi:MAG TPA: CAP domain-containing protein [Ramlibacter sp.]|nr:CAP domain-containing protein [Ramlibacter sp.]